MNMALFETCAAWNNTGATTAEPPASAEAARLAEQEEFIIKLFGKFIDRPENNRPCIQRVCREVLDGTLYIAATNGKHLMVARRSTDEENGVRLIPELDASFVNYRQAIPREGSASRPMTRINLRNIPRPISAPKKVEQWLTIKLPAGKTMQQARQTDMIARAIEKITAKTGNKPAAELCIGAKGDEPIHITAMAGKWTIEAVAMPYHAHDMHIEDHNTELTICEDGSARITRRWRGPDIEIVEHEFENPAKLTKEQKKNKKRSGIRLRGVQRRIEVGAILPDDGNIYIPETASRERINEFLKQHSEELKAIAWRYREIDIEEHEAWHRGAKEGCNATDRLEPEKEALKKRVQTLQEAADRWNWQHSHFTAQDEPERAAAATANGKETQP